MIKRMADDSKIYVGYFEKFQTPTILFFGAQKAYAVAAKIFSELAQKNMFDADIGELDVFNMGNVKIRLQIAPQATGMRKISANTFNWGLSHKELQLFSGNFSNL